MQEKSSLFECKVFEATCQEPSLLVVERAAIEMWTRTYGFYLTLAASPRMATLNKPLLIFTLYIFLHHLLFV